MLSGSLAASIVTTSVKHITTAARITPRGDSKPRSASALDRTGCLPDGCPGNLVWDYDRTELIADGIIHATGLVLAVLGVTSLILLSWPLASDWKTISILIYAGGLVAMLGFSAAYNVWPVSPLKWRLRRFDHAAIFIFIAATYTPLVAHLKSDIATFCTLIGVWVVAGLGVLLKVRWPGRFDRLGIVLCLLLGCSGVLLYEPALAALPHATLWLIVVGGALYATGIVFHLRESLRFQNSIWHAFVLVAAVCHYAAILTCKTGA